MDVQRLPAKRRRVRRDTTTRQNDRANFPPMEVEPMSLCAWECKWRVPACLLMLKDRNGGAYCVYDHIGWAIENTNEKKSNQQLSNSERLVQLRAIASTELVLYMKDVSDRYGKTLPTRVYAHLLLWIQEYTVHSLSDATWQPIPQPNFEMLFGEGLTDRQKALQSSTPTAYTPRLLPAPQLSTDRPSPFVENGSSACEPDRFQSVDANIVGISDNEISAGSATTDRAPTIGSTDAMSSSTSATEDSVLGDRSTPQPEKSSVAAWVQQTPSQLTEAVDQPTIPSNEAEATTREITEPEHPTIALIRSTMRAIKESGTPTTCEPQPKLVDVGIIATYDQRVKVFNADVSEQTKATAQESLLATETADVNDSLMNQVRAHCDELLSLRTRRIVEQTTIRNVKAIKAQIKRREKETRLEELRRNATWQADEENKQKEWYAAEHAATKGQFEHKMRELKEEGIKMANWIEERGNQFEA